MYPTLKRAANMETIQKAPFWSLKEILSINNVPFKSFAKTRRFRKELYGDWVAPLLSVDLMVESWLHGPGKLDSNCSAQKKYPLIVV
jgi:deoxyribonuclease II